MNGPMKRVIWVLYMANSGGVGKLHVARRLIKFPMLFIKLKRILIRADFWSLLLILAKSNQWRFRLVMPFFSSMLQMESSLVSFISEVQIFFWASLLISLRTLCSLTWLRKSAICRLEFVHTFGDAHLYKNHFEQAQLQLQREFRPLPRLTLNPNIKNIFDFTYDDIVISEYDPHPAIRAEVSI
jgi:hypothetical protein